MQISWKLARPYSVEVRSEDALILAETLSWRMRERKVWSEREDVILKQLKEVRGLKKWSEIARIMEEEFSMRERNGKQCRERYHNHLDASIVTAEWSHQEEVSLLRFHEELGNRWSAIAHKLPGRSDNCVKNHFYSKLRKSMRRLNRLIQEKYRKECHEIKLSLLNRVIQTTEERFKAGSSISAEIVQQCVAIKNELFRLNHSNDNPEEATLKALIDSIMNIQAALKQINKSLKQHKSSIQTTYPSSKEPRNQVEQAPFYEIFKRVCEEILLDP